MAQRGRKSAAELAVIGPQGIETVERPKPPAHFTAEQAAEWRNVVNRMPAEWFPRETWPLLIQYVRHTVSSHRIEQLIQGMEGSDDLDFDEYDKLLRARERESRCLAALATRMRLSQQSSYDAKQKKPKQGKRPWQIEG